MPSLHTHLDLLVTIEEPPPGDGVPEQRWTQTLLGQDKRQYRIPVSAKGDNCCGVANKRAGDIFTMLAYFPETLVCTSTCTSDNKRATPVFRAFVRRDAGGANIKSGSSLSVYLTCLNQAIPMSQKCKVCVDFWLIDLPLIEPSLRMRMPTSRK